jgi:hypothetical protein
MRKEHLKMKRTTPTAKQTTGKTKSKATTTDATGAKLDAVEGSPMIEKEIKIYTGNNKVQRFTISGHNEEELEKAREELQKLREDEKQRNRSYMEANVKKFGTACPSPGQYPFPPFPFDYEGPNEPKRTAWIVKAQSDMIDWFDSPAPSRIISFIAVLGRAEAYKIHLHINEEFLTKETIHLSPRDVVEITYKRRLGITFKTGFKLHLKYCIREKISMAEIQNDADIQQVIEEHFSEQPKPAKLSKKQIEARRNGGKTRAAIDDKFEPLIMGEWNHMPTIKSKKRKSEIIAERCAIGKAGAWKHNLNITTTVTRKDGDPATPNNILKSIERWETKKNDKKNTML